MSRANAHRESEDFLVNSPASLDEKLVKRRRRLLGSAYRLFYDRPVHLVRGEGVWLYDREGQAYLDAYNNVPVVGHCHPHVVDALAKQAAILNTHTRYLHEGVLEYAETLLETFPEELDQVMFTCSGTESNDLALRLAKNFTGGTGVIITDHAYHGGSMATAELSPALGAGYIQPEHVVRIPAPNAYRAMNGCSVEDAFAKSVDKAIRQLSSKNIKPAALLVDTVFSSDGLFVEPAGFLAPALRVMHQAGGLFIADEVQGGFGRSGSHMWAFERHGVTPDIVTMGKPMGNGHPVAGLVAQQVILDAFGRDCRYFNTFGGSPVSSRVGLAVLDVIRKERLMQNAVDVGAYLLNQLHMLMARYPMIGDVRGAGLFIGVELVANKQNREPDGKLATRIVNAMREYRVLISAAGPGANVLKIRPPLPFSRSNADFLLDVFERCLIEAGADVSG